MCEFDCRSIRVHVRATASFTREVEGDVQHVVGYFQTTPGLINSSTDLDIDGIRSSLDSQIENFNAKRSGFTIDRILEFTIVITKYRPLHNRSYIPSPKWLQNKRCVVNVRNEDEKCFLWAVLSCLHKPLYNKSHTNHYKPHLTSLKVSGIDFPMSPKQIPLFEEQNPEISINLYAVDPGNTEIAFTVEYLSPHKERQHHVNLLLLEEPETGKRHYTWIRDMSRLVAHRTNHHGKTYVCNSCLHPFISKEAHDNHLFYCQSYPAQHVIYLDPADSELKFKSVQKQHPAPFYLVCDFESFLTPSNTVDDEKDDVDASSGRIRTIDEHKVSGFCCYRVTSYPKYQTPPTLYSGADDVMDVFYQHVFNELNIINWIVSDNVEMLSFTPEQEAEFEAATICGSCKKPYTDDNHKVRHHCHISGKFLFPCCNNCNLQLKPIARSRKKRQDKIEKRLKAGKKRHLQITAEWAADQYKEKLFFSLSFFTISKTMMATSS